MKKYNFVFLACCLFAVPIHAQVAISTARELAIVSRGVKHAMKKGSPVYLPHQSTVGRTGLYSFQIKRVLQRRVERTHQEALKAQRTIPRQNKEKISYKPTTGLSVLDPAFVKPMQDNVPYLENSKKNVAAHLAAQENRLYVQEVRRLHEQVWPRLSQALPRLEQEAMALEQPADPLHFVVQKIPQTVNTVFVGELHGTAQTKDAVGLLLNQLRQIHPEREILLFTEFLPEHFEWEEKLPDWYQRPFLQIPGFEVENQKMLWTQARALNIPVIGLEVKIAWLNRKIIPRFKPTRTAVPAALTGMKFRNEHFMKTLQEYRAKHPDALFVVYTGKGHVLYNNPFSLANQLPAEKTFVLSIHPDLKLVAENLKVPLERITKDGINAPVPFANSKAFEKTLLFWSDRELARATGFDAYIDAGAIVP